jgi:bifunctional UDP-N-acetylglucosamine pyrophosphorylase / glucosamine-1-phosphate N-acetyltransferase
VTSGAVRPAVVVLAAGQGTRMRSRLPKVLHEAAGAPLLAHVLDAARALDPDPLLVVVGHGADSVRARFADAGVGFVTQERQRGTGDAVAVCADALDGHPGPIVVVSGDGPLVEGASLVRLLAAHRDAGGEGMTMLTVEADDPTGLGRVVRGRDGGVRAIVEERDADDSVRALREVNPGTYAFDARLWDLLPTLGDANAAGEVYLTDLVVAYLQDGRRVRAVRADDETRRLVGVNDRGQLAQADRILRDRLRRRWLAAGVTMTDPSSVFLDADVALSIDTVLEPGVVLAAGTRVGEGARIGAYAHLSACEVLEGAVVAPHTVARGRTFGGAG